RQLSCGAVGVWRKLTLHIQPIFHCGGHLVTDSGIVASEGFPSPYKPNSKCTWYITVPEGHVVMLSFRLFDMEADPTCRYDYLDIYNGHTRLVQKLGRFCGTFRPGAVISTSNTMMLEMVSDDSTGGRGFLASFSAGKPHMEEHQFCGGRLIKSQGSVKTPNWPNSNYPAGISCSWHISVEPNNVIEVKFMKLDLEPDTYCRYDYVALFNGGERDNSRRIGKFCGDTSTNDSPLVILLLFFFLSNVLLVQFVSDLSVTSDGFMAHYTSIPLKPPPRKPINKPTAKPKPQFNVLTTCFLPCAFSSALPLNPLCTQACKRTGTLQSSFCPHDFVITGKITSLTTGPRGSARVEVALIKAYKAGKLNITKSGPIMSITLASTCKRCPGLIKGRNYVLMGKVDTQGNGLLSPSSFSLLYKPIHAKALANLLRKPC
uniref:Procollagen C-endopeptidase enhancer b n=1 Tax=Cyclopterus lumpus TaxID=8103 RepID=A0A8C3AG36_CYCLU